MSDALAHTFLRASGPSVADCVFLAARFPERDGDLRPGEGETWLCRSVEGRVRVELGGAGWLTGLWRSPAGAVYAVDAAGRILSRTHDDAPWSSHDVPGTLLGVTGFAHDVWAWGTLGAETTLFVKHGEQPWQRVESPGPIVALHGCDDGAAFAVGLRGLVARYDGTTWRRMEPPTAETLHGVFTASPTAAWAITPDGAVFEGGEYGWHLHTQRDHTLYSVAMWRNTVWLGAPFPDGLLRDGTDGLVTHHRELDPLTFDTRGDLLLANPYLLASSDDGDAWLRMETDTLERALAPHPFAPAMRRRT